MLALHQVFEPLTVDSNGRTVATDVPAGIDSCIVPNPARGTEKVVYIRFAGKITANSVKAWAEHPDTRRILSEVGGKPFFVVADLRRVNLFDGEAQAMMAGGQRIFAESGMKASYNISSGILSCRQFHDIAKNSGICENEFGCWMTPENQKSAGAELGKRIMQYAMDWCYGRKTTGLVTQTTGNGAVIHRSEVK